MTNYAIVTDAQEIKRIMCSDAFKLIMIPNRMRKFDGIFGSITHDGTMYYGPQVYKEKPLIDRKNVARILKRHG